MTTEQFLKTGHVFSESENKALKRSNVLCGRKAKSIREYSYIKVDKFKNQLKNNEILEVISEILGISLGKILKTKHTDFVYFTKWLQDEFEVIGRMEARLYVEPSSEMIDAGIEELQEFGIMNVIKALSGGQVWKYKEVEDTNWNVIYVTLLMNKKENEIKQAMLEIQKQKSKNKT